MFYRDIFNHPEGDGWGIVGTTEQGGLTCDVSGVGRRWALALPYMVLWLRAWA
jgi:hypothetical protein